MRTVFLLIAILAGCSHVSLAIYGQSLIRTDPAVAALACRTAGFTEGVQIARAIQDGSAISALQALRNALPEFQQTPKTSPLYPSQAFCIHELIPSSLATSPDDAKGRIPPPVALEMRSLGLNYVFYEPDGRFILRQNPVDLEQLATDDLDSRWGREAFLMMTYLGWSRGSCAEGPDQFREVIKHGNRFLMNYPESETSDKVRLEVAHAYATWWNLSLEDRPDGINPTTQYKEGADEAKEMAIRLYSSYLSTHGDAPRDVQNELNELRDNPKGSKTFAYYCAEYDD